MPPPDKPAKPPASARDAKLAEALRANLRRRKSAGGPKAPRPNAGKNDAAD